MKAGEKVSDENVLRADGLEVDTDKKNNNINL